MVNLYLEVTATYVGVHTFTSDELVAFLKAQEQNFQLQFVVLTEDKADEFRQLVAEKLYVTKHEHPSCQSVVLMMYGKTFTYSVVPDTVSSPAKNEIGLNNSQTNSY
uniref:Nonstructural protein n=1 Tax=Panagrellus redivivus TaxID=6233 RepID=A0A7E4V8P5_PANRE